MKLLVTLFLIGLLTGALGACTFTYLPPVREGRTPQERLELGAESALEQAGNSLQLKLTLEAVPEAGWLAVQWFDPSNDEAAATSVWLEPKAVGKTRTVMLPERVALRPGTWRAVLSYEGRLVRQFSLEVTGN